MTTNEDIVAALSGNPTPSATRKNDNVVEALRTGRRPGEVSDDDRILEALQGPSYTRSPIPGELPLQDRGDEMEAVRVWAAQEATMAASTSLAQALMRADPEKGIYAAEAEARAIGAEAYAIAAQTLVHEDDRQKHVQKYLAALTARTAGVREASKAHDATGTKRLKTSISGTTGQPIHHYE